jgi:hypothetical protein
MSFHLHQEPGLLHLTFSGLLSEADLVQMVEHLKRIEASAASVPNRLTDLTGVTGVAIGFTNVLAVAEERRGQRFPNAFKSAIVVGDEVQRGFARMYQTLNDHPQISIEVFSEVESALAWLREVPEGDRR